MINHRARAHLHILIKVIPICCNQDRHTTKESLIQIHSWRYSVNKNLDRLKTPLQQFTEPEHTVSPI